MKNHHKKFRNLAALVGIGLSSFLSPTKVAGEGIEYPQPVQWVENFDSGISRPYIVSHPDKWLINDGYLEAKDLAGEPVRLSFNDKTYRSSECLRMLVKCSKSAWSKDDRLCIQIGDDADNASGTYWEFCINASQENPYYLVRRVSPEFNYTFVEENHPAIVPGGTYRIELGYCEGWYFDINLTFVRLNRVPPLLEGKIGVSVYSSMGVAHFDSFLAYYIPSVAHFPQAGAEGLSLKFTRGDSNEDGRVNLDDPIKTLTDLFECGGCVKGDYCWDGADANDDGKVNIDDPLYTLAFLFLGGPGIPPPYYGLEPGTLAKGIDTTEDPIYCKQE